ncbi:MAG: PIN domain-containing protein [Flavobacteriales bacterium]|nr:PIN domain-containing protein [Flavobacteriales bacterium]
MIHCLVDSDIILDVYLRREPFAIYSAQVLNYIKYKKIKGSVTALSLANVYYILSKGSSKKLIIAELIKLTSFVEVESMNNKTVQNALFSDFSDFEDALQNFSAENNSSISHIVTRNVKDYKSSKLVVLSPKEFLAVV